MSELAIREIGTDEFVRVWPFFQAIVAAGDTYTYPLDMSFELARTIWTTPPARCFVAERDDQVLGCYRLAPNQMGPGNHVGTGSYMVAPEARGQGIASAMCRHSLEQARQAGFTAMQFNAVVASNTIAVQLWQRHGFRIVGTVPGAFRHLQHGPVDLYVMHRPL
ncbi:N-acetyltransferase family protein [Rhodanobacter lindaniclasticus]